MRLSLLYTVSCSSADAAGRVFSSRSRHWRESAPHPPRLISAVQIPNCGLRLGISSPALSALFNFARFTAESRELLAALLFRYRPPVARGINQVLRRGENITSDIDSNISLCNNRRCPEGRRSAESQRRSLPLVTVMRFALLWSVLSAVFNLTINQFAITTVCGTL